ncbi:hypothetical protein PODOV006v2_p0004 [Vibrio phage 15E36.1]|uniref:Uncharacterized protein n=1 Tax=Vibrio phage 15E36.1 TaxID=2859290 RepID=A0AAE8C4P0_9CAUD|nr:hypothetical protein PODOV006v2_p0004 [Vibrio phage 15E36.1]
MVRLTLHQYKEPRMQAITRTNTPVLFELAQPSITLKVEDLSNLNHPVNIKALSGKREGMACMVGGVIYKSTGSNPSDVWERAAATKLSNSILRSVDNPEDNVCDGISTLEPAKAVLLPVEDGLLGDWLLDTQTATVTYQGVGGAMEFICSGDVSTIETVNWGNNITVELYDDTAGDGLTGATKVYPITRRQGLVSSIDFTLVGYGYVNNGDIFSLRVGSNIVGDFNVNNVLWAIKPLL